MILREVVKKKQISYGQAHQKRLHPPPYCKIAVKFFCVCIFILDYDSMCSEMDFTPVQLFSSNYKNSQLVLKRDIMEV